MNAKLCNPIVLSLLLLLANSCSQEKEYSLVPAPCSITTTQGVCLVPKEISVFAQDEAIRQAALVWAESLTRKLPSGRDTTKAGHIRTVSGEDLPPVHLSGGYDEALIVLMQDSSIPAEGYRLLIGRKGIEIAGGTPQGIFWGLQSLTQILLQSKPDGKGNRRIQSLLIEDCPAYKHRGALLDCCRYFYSVDEVKAFIDILAAHKMNVFHWHLTDDQGWRLEIKKYPRLASVGSLRRATIVGRNSKKEEENVYDGVPYGPFYYTQDEAREIVRYAADRFITVIPEIEMPGHCLGAIASYPWLSCNGKPKEVSPGWGVFADGVVCPAKESTYRFLEGVLDEVCNIFPSEYIHIGGDEAPRRNWESCPDCQRKMKQMSFSREAELQSYLISRIESYLELKGRRIIGWDEILVGGASKSATVMCWHNVKTGIEAVRQGNRVIMTPRQNCYLDYYQTTDPDANGENLAPLNHFLPLKQCYALNPSEGLEPEESELVIGLQGNVWCEYISSFDHVQFMLLPRLAALSEVAWNKEKDSYEQFLIRLRNAMLPVYEYHGWVYAPFAFNVPAS